MSPINVAESMKRLVGTPLREIEEEFVSIAEMQNRIMPDLHELPEFGDFDIYGMTLPITVVGGDFYDFVDVEKKFAAAGKIGLVVADASGHGLSAAMLIRDFNTALYTAISFQMHYEHDTTPLLFEKMNRRMFRSSLPSQYITAFYAELHLDGKIRYVNAGHLPPILFKKDKTNLLEVGGPVLGALCDLPERYSVGQELLENGDCLVCFTDGIIEAPNRFGEEYGAERLKGLVERHRGESARSLFNRIIQDASRFSEDAPQLDDWTLLVVKKGKNTSEPGK